MSDLKIVVPGIGMLFRNHGLEEMISDDNLEPPITATSTEAEKKTHRQWVKDDARTASLIGTALRVRLS